MDKTLSGQEPPRDRTVLIPDFFGKGEPLMAYQLGWDIGNRIEAKSSVSKKIFEYYVEDLGRNLIFYYLEDGNFYGIHAESCPTPVFRFNKDDSEEVVIDQLKGDTHDFEDGEIICWVDSEHNIWDEVRIDGKSLEQVLQRSYIVNIS